MNALTLFGPLGARATQRPLSLAAAVVLLALFLLGTLPHTAAAQGANAEDPDASPVWQQLRTSLFQQRPIATGDDSQIGLEAPVRAEDAAIVPISVSTRFEQTPERYVRKLWLVIDNNPSPVGAVFTFTPESGKADIETRVRVDAYTHVRAIAELNTSELMMSTRFVKASGGCSAPPGKDQAAAMATLGKMRFRVDGDMRARQPVLAQLMISHPNNSGLVMDQLTRHFTPAHFVRRIDVSYAGKPILTAEVDFSISENPNFRFYFVPEGEGELRAEVVDTDDLRFDTAVRLQPGS